MPEPKITLRLDNSTGRYTPARRVFVTTVQPRSWWRRLFRLPAKRVRRGPFTIEPWPGSPTEPRS